MVFFLLLFLSLLFCVYFLYDSIINNKRSRTYKALTVAHESMCIRQIVLQIIHSTDNTKNSILYVKHILITFKKF